MKIIQHKRCHILAALAVLFFICIGIKAQTQPFQFRVNFAEFSNLAYQLECLGDRIFCHKEDFEALWQKEFLQTDEDQTMLASWKNWRRHYQKSFALETDLKFPLERRTGSLDLSHKLTIAGLQAKDLADYLASLELLVAPREREKFAIAIRHFAPRFALWWKREASAKGAAFVKKTEALLAAEKLPTNIAQLYNFYEPDLPANYAVTFDLIYRPDLVKSGNSGFSLENHQPIEFFFDDDPKRRIDVIVHELCHFMYYSIAPEKHLALQNLLLTRGRAAAIPAYNLLDETLASALGNGIIRRLYTNTENWQQYFARDLSFYNNPNIDKAGKALLPVLAAWLATGGKLTDDNFVNIYLNTLEHTFGAKLTSPQLQLLQLFLFIDQNFAHSLRTYFRRTLNVASHYGETGDLSRAELADFSANPNINSTFIIQPDRLNQLSAKKIVTPKDFTAIKQIYQAEKQVLYAVKRNEHSYIFIIVAETNETAQALITDLADAPHSFLGQFKRVSKK